jgi:hypothetical protein
MRVPFILVLLLGCSAWAQTPEVERTFLFKHARSGQDMGEISTAVSRIADLSYAQSDDATKTLTVRGSEPHVALADWLFQQLDGAPASGSSTQVYQLAGETDPVVQIMYRSSEPGLGSFQEAATVIRSITMMRRLFTYYTPRALVMRGTAEQASLAEWLSKRLTQPDGTNYQMASGEMVRVFKVTHATTMQDFQEVATLVRAIGDIRFSFTYDQTHAVAIRGSAGDLALATWAMQQLDQTSHPQSAANYRISDSPEGDVRIVYLSQETTLPDLQKVAMDVRSGSGVRYMFTYRAPRAIAFRGTPDQVAAAERLLAAQQ